MGEEEDVNYFNSGRLITGGYGKGERGKYDFVIAREKRIVSLQLRRGKPSKITEPLLHHLENKKIREGGKEGGYSHLPLLKDPKARSVSKRKGRDAGKRR